MWIIILPVVIFVSFFVFLKIRDQKLLKTVTKAYRGTWSERNLVLKLLKLGMPAQTIFHDLYLKKYNGKFSQIDLVVPTKVGIIVFEVKDYSGWIFGNGYHRQWTQVLAYGKEKYRFYNPIMQNNSHITELRKQLKQNKNIKFYSVIVFYGNCELKNISNIPENTFITYSQGISEIINGIINNNQLANYMDKREVVNVLNEAVQNGENIETQIKHIENIRDLLDNE
jgi:hypothetical protein